MRLVMVHVEGYFCKDGGYVLAGVWMESACLKLVYGVVRKCREYV